eukprot:gb/GEZN01004239.1/.p1 GENE.gb/GEZN01004239.1/~~gb/GEZN01004239.1/.p1  ORF type:complete len:574 (-),score=62.10 gb/GEZN01004239.1/:138-1859(-)
MKKKLAVKLAVQATASEKKIFHFLVGAVQRFKLKDTELRVAGGWVRDKLWGKSGSDIDIAIKNMSGIDYARYLKKYADELKIGARFGIIRSNPAKSKHLETVTATVFQTNIDLCHLRSDEYSRQSRIPTAVVMGTPLADAKRRDYTVNSLFYNLHTFQVEDWVGTGLQDLALGILRTPNDPNVTFDDDPLRVLRGLKFVSRFGLYFEEGTLTAAKDPSIAQKLAQKVSVERILLELEGMFFGRFPVEAMQLLGDFGGQQARNVVLPRRVPWTNQAWQGAINRMVFLELVCESMHEASKMRKNVASKGDKNDTKQSCSLKPDLLSRDVLLELQLRLSLYLSLIYSDDLKVDLKPGKSWSPKGLTKSNNIDLVLSAVSRNLEPLAQLKISKRINSLMWEISLFGSWLSTVVAEVTAELKISSGNQALPDHEAFLRSFNGPHLITLLNWFRWFRQPESHLLASYFAVASTFSNENASFEAHYRLTKHIDTALANCRAARCIHSAPVLSGNDIMSNSSLRGPVMKQVMYDFQVWELQQPESASRESALAWLAQQERSDVYKNLTHFIPQPEISSATS